MEKVSHLYLELDLSDLGYFKMVVKGRLLEEIDLIDDHYFDEEIDWILPVNW